MHPELLHVELPDFLAKIFGISDFILYTYATLIILGTLIASFYTKREAKNELGVSNLSNNFFYIVFLAGFVGGKLFYYLQDPTFYIKNPGELLHNFSGGFVFYGSFVVIIPVVIWYLRKHQIPVLPMLDILAITTTIVHAIGRFGCFNAGCCYGNPTDSAFGMTFPTTNHIVVHPTQLYEIAAILSIMVLLIYLKNRKKFEGQIFLTYVALYAIARSVLERFRGDERGFIIENILSHSQFIALCLLLIVGVTYINLKNKQQII